MSHVTTESDDEMLTRAHSDSPVTDEGGSSDLKKGPWTSAEDAVLIDYVRKHGEGNWNSVQKNSGLSRCGKSCRLRWANHLRPNLKKGAFTPDEERLIVQLHARMGNKWARMAAHLPGRTDNEIKNYWNTRIKRRQRAGLPLYPPEICLRQMQEKQLNQNPNDGGQNEHLQPNNLEIPEIVFDNLKDEAVPSPYITDFPCISTNGMLMNNTINPFMPPIVHFSKRPRETATSSFGYQNYHPQFEQKPFDDSFGNVTSQTFDPMTMNQFAFGGNQGDHSLINGNFSAYKPSSSTYKLELPSLQYPESDLSSWGSLSPPAICCESVDGFIQSPYPSPNNSGLLDSLVNGVTSKNSQTQKHSQNMVMDTCEPKWEEYGDAISPLGDNVPFIFGDCTPLSGGGSSLEENAPAQILPGSKRKSVAGEQIGPMDEEKKENGTKLIYTRPDTLLGMIGYPDPASEYISAPIHDDFGSAFQNDDLGRGQKRTREGCNSCQWNNMPPVCQMSEHP